MGSSIKIVAVMLCAAVIVSCAGADGAAGPQGPAGPAGPQGTQGIPGPVNFVSLSGVTSSTGSGSVSFPTIPANAKPVLTCYITSSLTPPVAWLLVSDGFSTGSALCGLVQGTGGSWGAAMIRAPSFWFYYMVVIW
jgi:hypothetical protein